MRKSLKDTSTLNKNPYLSAVKGETDAKDETIDTPRAKEPPRKSYGFKLREEIVERMRDAAYWIPGLTMTAIVEKSVEQYLDQLEKDMGKIAPRSGDVKTGRPPKM
jgi:hypothetical protein